MKNRSSPGIRTIVAMLALASLAAFAFLSSCSRASTVPPQQQAQTAQDKTKRIASMAPACTAIIAKLGLAGNIVACDTWSGTVEGVREGAVRFDMMKPDAERLAALEPDIVFVSAITKEGTSRDPFKPLSDAGVRVVYLPTSSSVNDIRGDITRIASLLGRETEGEEAIAGMDAEIARISAIAKQIPEGKRRTVVFEIGPAPYIYSFGSGVYLDELLTIAGARNALAKEKGWIAVSAEAVVASNPDVILTNVSSLSDPVAEIKGRPGWSGVKAVKEGRVYRIDGNASSQPGPGVVKALAEISKAVYPEYFK